MYVYIYIYVSLYIYINRETNEYIYAYLCIYEPYGYGEVILNDYYFFRMYNTKPYESCPSVKRYQIYASSIIIMASQYHINIISPM